MDVRRRILEKVKGDDEEVTYELDAPKLIVDYTVTEAKKFYEFTSTDYPDLEKCKWVNIVARGDLDTQPGYIHCSVNGTVIGEAPSPSGVWNFEIREATGLFYCEGRSGNIYTISSNNPRRPVTIGTNPVLPRGNKFEPIKKLKFQNPLTNILPENGTIKIYGFY